MYSARLLDHFQNPRHAGELPAANFRVRQENPVCGDILELSALTDDGHLAEIRFRAKGCVPAMACASALCELAHGKSLSAVKGIKKEDVLSAVGGVPPASDHAAQLALDALAALLRQAASPKDAAATR
jgi:nitrogen fixation protein NifU and related proteins